MAIAEVIEINASSPNGFEDAIQQGLARATATVQDDRGAWIKEFEVRVEHGKITEYRGDMMRSVSLITVLACGLALCQGCGTSVRGLDGDLEARIKYGTLIATMDRGIERVYQAVLATVSSLGLTTVLAEQDGVAAEVLVRDAQGQNINIRLEAVSTSKTELTLRVGMLGDKNKSRVIFREIQDNLRAG